MQGGRILLLIVSPQQMQFFFIDFSCPTVQTNVSSATTVFCTPEC